MHTVPQREWMRSTATITGLGTISYCSGIAPILHIPLRNVSVIIRASLLKLPLALDCGRSERSQGVYDGCVPLY